MTKPKETSPETSFEQQLGQLDALVRQLEQGDLPLEQALIAFEHGTKLVKACRAQLTGIELKVEQIIAATEADDGDVTTHPFNAD